MPCFLQPTNNKIDSGSMKVIFIGRSDDWDRKQSLQWTVVFETTGPGINLDRLNKITRDFQRLISANPSIDPDSFSIHGSFPIHAKADVPADGFLVRAHRNNMLILSVYATVGTYDGKILNTVKQQFLGPRGELHGDRRESNDLMQEMERGLRIRYAWPDSFFLRSSGEAYGTMSKYPRFPHVKSRGRYAVLKYYEKELEYRSLKHLVILDVCSGLKGYWPYELKAIGISPDGASLAVNTSLSTRICLDLNNLDDILRFKNRLEYPDDTVDMMMINFTFGYLIHPQNVLKAMQRKLKKGGRMHVIIGRSCVENEAIAIWSASTLKYSMEEVRMAYVREVFMSIPGWKIVKSAAIKPIKDADELICVVVAENVGMEIEESWSDVPLYSGNPIGFPTVPDDFGMQTRTSDPSGVIE